MLLTFYFFCSSSCCCCCRCCCCLFFYCCFCCCCCRSLLHLICELIIIIIFAVTTGDHTKVFVRNVMGTVLGMLLFRESLRGTCGESVYRCWRDLKAWSRLADPVKRMYWTRVIKNKYIVRGSAAELTSLNVRVFGGKHTCIILNDNYPFPEKGSCLSIIM